MDEKSYNAKSPKIYSNLYNFLFTRNKTPSHSFNVPRTAEQF